MKELTINHLAVWLIVVIGQLIPALWYGLFSESWMAYNELTMDYIEANQRVTPYIASIVSSVIFAYVLAWVFKQMRVESALNGLAIGLLMGFAFTHLPLLIQNLFSFRPYGLSWIDGGVNLVIWGVAGAILGGWRKYRTA